MDNIIFSTNAAIPCISLEHWPNLFVWGAHCMGGLAWGLNAGKCLSDREGLEGRSNTKLIFQGFCAFLLTLLSISWKFLYINSFCPSFECALLFPCTLRTVFWMFSTNGSSWTRSLLDNFSFKKSPLENSQPPRWASTNLGHLTGLSNFEMRQWSRFVTINDAA